MEGKGAFRDHAVEAVFRDGLVILGVAGVVTGDDAARKDDAAGAGQTLAAIGDQRILAGAARPDDENQRTAAGRERAGVSGDTAALTPDGADDRMVAIDPDLDEIGPLADLDGAAVVEAGGLGGIAGDQRHRGRQRHMRRRSRP